MDPFLLPYIIYHYFPSGEREDMIYRLLSDGEKQGSSFKDIWINIAICRIYFSSFKVLMQMQPVTSQWPDNLCNHPATHSHIYQLCQYECFLGAGVGVEIKHCIADETKTSLPPLDRLKNLRSTGEPRESDWSRNIPVIRWFSSEGTIFQEKTLVCLSDHSVSSNWHFVRLGMINTPWHSFHARREGHWYLLLVSKISSNLSKT